MPDPIIPSTPQNNTVFTSDISQGPIQSAPPVPSVARPEDYNLQPAVDLRNMKATDILASIPDKSGINAANEPVFTSEQQTRRYGANFNPFVDNEENFAKNQSWYSKLGNDIVKTGAIALSSFADGLMAIPDTIRGLSGGNVYKNSWAESLDKWQTNLEDEFPNYYTKWEQEHPFASAVTPTGFANFWFDKVLKNTGFTIGAIGSAALQDVAVGAISEGIGEAPLVAEQVGKASLWLNKLFTGTNDLEKALQATSDIEKSTQAIASMQQLYSAAQGTKVLKGAEYLATLWGASHAEAGMEARQGYDQVKQDLINEYYEKKGYYPTGEDLDTIDKTATASANVRYGINMGLLMASNAIQFDNILKPWNSFKQGLKKGLEAQTEEQAGRIALEEAPKTAADVDRLKLIPDNKLNKILKRAVPNILAEGVYEEGGQYAAQVGTQKYYEDKYNGKIKGNLDDIINASVGALKEQFGTTEGKENMLLGGITGLLFGPIERKVENIQRSRAGVFNPEQAAAHAVNQLNSQSVLGIMLQNYDATASTLQAKEDIGEAVKNNDVFKFKNLQRDQFYNFVDSGIKANRFDVRLEQLKLLKELPNEELNKLFGIQEGDRVSNHEYIDKLIQKAQSIKDAHDALSSVFQNPFTYRGNPKTEDHIKENQAYLAFEDYKSALTKFSYNSTDFNNRLRDIQESNTKINPGITNELLSRLTSKEGLSNLKDIYEEKSADLQKQIDEKLVSGEQRINAQQQLKVLNSLSEQIKSVVNAADFNGEHYNKVFSKLLDFELNNRQVQSDNLISFPKEHSIDLIQKGHDINQINKGKQFASAGFEHLFSQEGYEDFLKNHQEWKDSLLRGENEQVDEETKPAETAPLFEANGKTYQQGRYYQKPQDLKQEYKVQEDGDKFNLISPEGNTIETFTDKDEADKQKDYQNQQLEKLDKVKVLGKTDTGKIRIEDSKGDTYAVEPELLTNHELVQTEEEISKQRTEFNKKVQNSFRNLSAKNASDTATGENNEAEKASVDKHYESQKKPLPILFKSTTYNRKDDKSYTHRQQEFFNKLNQLQDKKFKAVLVTQKNEESLGLKGLIDDVTAGWDGDKSTVIATAFIDEDRNLVNKEGKPIGKLGQQVDINNAVYGVMPTSDLSSRFNPSETRYSKGTPQEAAEYSKAWEERRKQILEHGDGNNTYDFYVTRGRSEYNGKDAEGNFIQSPVSKSLIDKADIGKQGIVKVVTKGFITHQGENINFPNGRPVFQYGSTLEWLNNRKFTKDEVGTIYDTFHLLAVRALQQEEIDPQIENYLQGVLQFKEPIQGKPISRNQVWVADGMLHLGGIEQIPFTPKGIEENEGKIKEYLQDTFQNINNKKLVDGLPFEQITGVENGELKTVNWKSYQHYLISDTYDLLEDDPSELKSKQRSAIPLTTSIREVSTQYPVNFYYKSAVLTTNQEGASLFNLPEKKEEQKEETKAKEPEGIKLPKDAVKKVQETVTQQEEGSAEGTQIHPKLKLPYTAELTKGGWKIGFPQSEILNDLVKKLEASGKNQEESISILRSVVANDLPKVEQTVSQEEEKLPTQTNKPSALPKSGRFSGDFRIAKDNQQYQVANLDKEEKWFKANISEEVPFQRVRNLIATTGGGYAFGQFKNAIVYIYENAETGTTYHEAFHAIYSMFTDLKEKQALLNEFRSKDDTFTDRETGKTVKFSEATDKQAVEQMAENFREYALYEQKPEGNFIQKLFRDIVNFVKRIFTGTQVKNIDDLFSKINSGFYKNMPVKSGFSEVAEYRTIPGLTVTDSYNLVRGNAIEVLQQIFRENKNIVDLEESSIQPAEVYQNVYKILKQSFASEGEIADSIPELYKSGQITEDQYRAYKTLWDNISNNWGSVVELTNEYLNTFGIVSKLSAANLTDLTENPEGVIKDKESEETSYDGGRSSDSYLQDAIKLDFKKNAATRIKLLYATLTESVFDQQSPSGIVSKVDAGTYMQKAIVAAKAMNYTMSQVFSYNTLAEKIDALKEIANTNPDYVRLVNRLGFNDNLGKLSNSEWKMAISWFNTFSKQRPEAVIQYIDKTGVYSGPPNLNTAARVLSQSWIDNLKLSAGPGKIINVDKEGNYNFNSAVVPKTDADLLKVLGAEFDSYMLSNLSKKDKDQLSATIGSIRTFLSKKGNINIANIEEKGNFQKLAELYTKAKGEGWETTFTNTQGERVQQYLQGNTISSITNDINNAIDKGNLLQVLPHLSNLYSQDSWYLKNLFDEKGEKNEKKLQIGYIDGIVNTITDRNTPLSKVDPVTRLVTEINQNLNKNYYLLVPADSKTEWMLQMEHPIELSALDTNIAQNRINNIFSAYYNTERQIAESTKGYKGLLYDINNGYREEFSTDKLKDYIDTRVNNLIDYLEKNDRINTETTLKNGETITKYKLNGIEGYNDKKLSKIELNKLFTFLEVNYIINNIELHKLFFGDYNNIKDPLKRYKSFLSPRETTVYNTPELNNFLNQDLNKANGIELKPGDPGYHEHKDYIPTVTLSDIISEEVNITNDDHLPKEIKEAYKKVNGADAQSWATLPAYREVMWKSGARWTKDMEKQFQYLMSQDRLAMEEDGHYSYNNPKLKEKDLETIGKNDPQSAVFQILKPVGSGFALDGKTFLDKTSVAPLTYSRVRRTNLENMYVKMHKEGIGYTIVESGRKIGGTAKDNIYSTEPFKQEAKLNIPFRYYGIQVETGAEKDKGTLGSQLTKLAYVNLYDKGVPRTEEIGNKVKRNIEALKALQENGYNKLLDKFGIVDNGEHYSIPDKSKIANVIKDELFRREAPENLKDILRLNEEGEFNIPLEAAINYQQVKNILYSYVDKLIAKPKVNGGQKIQLSGSGFEVKGKRIEAGKDKKGNPVYISSGLNFYEATYDDKGNRTSVSRMEVMLPNWFAKKLKKAGGKLAKMSNEELIDYLNSTEEGKKILNGIGFRIPTQEMNSVEAFTVKAFTPSWAGDSIVVPEAITTKAGSDFDVDKMNTYLKNVYIDSNGDIKEVPYLGTGGEAKQQFRELLDKISDKQELIDTLLPDENIKPYDALADFTFDSNEDILNRRVEELYSQSLENEYFNSLEDLVLLPENYERLVAPNNSEELMSLRDSLEKLAPEEFGSAQDKSVLNRLYMSGARHTFIMGKGGVGIAAVAQTNNSLNQLGKVVLDITKTDTLPAYQQQYIGDGQVYLPHNSVEVDGKNVPTLSGNKDVDGRYISDKISQYINGFVDVAKDPFIAQIIQNPSLTGTYLLLEKLGVPTSTVVYFMNQPIIREYMKLLADKGTTWKYDERNIEPIRNRFATNAKTITGKLEVSNAALKSNIETFYEGKELNNDEKASQQQILTEFLKYSVMADNLFNITQGTNYDTDSSADPVMQFRKAYKTEQARNANLWSTIDDLLNNSHLGSLKDVIADSSRAISESISKTEDNSISQYYTPTLSNLLEIRGLSKDDYQKAARGVQEQFITYAIQTSTKLNNRIKELLIDQESSVAKNLQEIRRSLPKNSDLYNNVIMQQLIPLLKNKSSNVKGVTIASKVSDTMTSDIYTDGFRELRDNPITQKLYYNLLRLSFLQSGISRSPISFFNYIPSEDYAKVVAPVIDKIQNLNNLSEFDNLGTFFRNSWSNTDLVPNVTEDFNDYGESKKRLVAPWFNSLREKYQVKDIRNNLYKLYTLSSASSARFVTMNLFADQLASDLGEGAGKVLLQRLEDEYGNPIVEGKGKFTYYIYTPINAWGDGVRAQEFYDTARQSEIDNGYLKIAEIPQQEILGSYRMAKGIPVVNRQQLESNTGGYIKSFDTLKAWDIGKLEGKPEATDRKTVNELVVNSSQKAGETGESFNEFRDRIIDTFRDLLKTAPDNTLVVTHSSAIKILDSWIKEGKTDDNKIDINDYLAAKTVPGSLSRYKSDNGTLLVARHGETIDNQSNRLRTSETGLTEDGIKEAQDLGEQLKGTQIPQIIASDLPRTMHTAEIIAAKVREPFETFDPNLSKVDTEQLQKAQQILNFKPGNCK